MGHAITREMVINTLYAYLENNRVYDYNFFIKFSGNRGIRDVNVALEFARVNLPEADFRRLQEKIFPFEAHSENEIEAKNELYVKALALAHDFTERKVSFIYIMDELNVSLEKFHYMCKQLAYQYKSLSISRFKVIEDFFIDNRCYDKKELPVKIRFPLLKDEEVNLIINELRKRNIALNDRSFIMMCDYYKKHIVSKNETIRR